MKLQYINPQPPDFIYDNPRSKYVLGGEESTSFVAQLLKDEAGNYYPRMEYIKGRGILTYFHGTQYPQKGFVTPETLDALNKVKTILMEVTKLAKNPVVLFGMILLRKQLLSACNTIFSRILKGYSIKRDYMCNASMAVEVFLGNIIGDETFAHFVAQFIENDDAYKYRVQDIFTELDVEAFRKNPRKELSRLEAIWESREESWSKVVYHKVKHIFAIARILMLIPPIKKRVCANIYILKIGQYDTDDLYWICFYNHGYNYTGKTSNERLQQYPEERPYMYKVKS